MDDLMRRVKALDPAPNDAELPTGMWSAAAVLESIDSRSAGAPPRYQSPKPEEPRWGDRWRRPVGIAAAAFAVVIAIGIAIAVLSGGGNGSGPVDQPTPTTVASTQATTVPTTEPVPTTATGAVPVAVTRDIAYSGTQQLDVWSPTTFGPWPVLVVLHGYGGPAATNVRSGYDALVESIAAGGVVVYNVEWPIGDRFLEEAETVACAVGFARATATDHGGSADRVTLLGHSNGGSMAATVALAAELLDPVADCATTDASIIPDALVGVAGDYAYATVPAALSLRETDAAAWQLIDPYSNIGRNPDLDVYLLHGDADDAVPVQSAIDFDQALRDAGYQVTLMVLEGVGHNSVVAPTFDAFGETVALALQAVHG